MGNLQANELRIGNLVYRTNKHTKEKLIIELTASCILDISCNGSLSSFLYEPIPLTEEWLLKFGFNKVYNEQDDTTEYFYPDWLPFLRDKTTFYQVYNVGNCFIEHVHQLQNLYFALTGEELKINHKNLI